MNSLPENTPGTDTVTAQTPLHVPNMTCGSCIQRVKGALLKVDGVTEVRARVDLHQVVVLHDPRRAPESALRNALQKTGYPAE